MDNYIVSARKYRPATFRSVIGQQSLTTTLKNAIRNNKLAHAYLFCGPRGVGKTTCARIFAKTINCSNLASDGEACNECESCQSFNEQRSYNIHELDAASNNSVDDIRSLIDQVRIPPQIGKYKVYIIDEVHMLSTNAFNAFLKTLEEPPHYAIFILATTEKHKILPTILSRCQIYDFNRISINDIVDYLSYVAEQENVTFEREALNVIAQKADGGMRDALSIFDQVVSFTGGNITYQSIIENLNVLDYEYYFKLTEYLVQCNVSGSLLLLNEILSKGFDGQHIVEGLASFFRDLLVCKDPETIILYEVGEVVKEKYLSVAKQCDTQFLYKAIEWSNDCDLAYRASKNKRLLTELLLIRLAQFNLPQSQEEDKKKTTLEPIGEKKQNSSIVKNNNLSPIASTTAIGRDTNSTPIVRHKESSKPKVTGDSVMRISLKNIKNQKEEEKAVAEVTAFQESSDMPFTQNELIEKWKRYASEIKEKLHLKNTMLNSLPELKENHKFVVLVYNQEQSQKLQEEAVFLLDFLRVQLRNTSIVMEVVMTEENKREFAYSDADKYKLMVSKNSELQNLVNEFHLRLD